MTLQVESPRRWGWDAWLEDQVLPSLHAEGFGQAQLWIFSGPPESGRDDMLDAFHALLVDRAGEGAFPVSFLERDSAETAMEWHSRAAVTLAQRREATPAGGTTDRSAADDWDMDNPAGPDDPLGDAPACVLVRDGDTIPVNRWRQQFNAWLAAHPDGRLFMTASHPNEALVDAFRQAGGSGGMIFQQALEPWSAAQIGDWKQEFFAHDQRSVEDLVRVSRGGWPGLLWELYEETEKRAAREEDLKYLRRVLQRMEPEERRWILAAAYAPVPARDCIEILLGQEIPFAQWRTAYVHWETSGFLHRDRGWMAGSIPSLIIQTCAELGEKADRAWTEQAAMLRVLHRFLPSEEARRRFAPLAIFQNLERDVLVGLYGEQGLRLWDGLLEVPGALASGHGPRPLHEDFRSALRRYAGAMPGGVDDSLRGRIKEIWAQRREHFRDEAAKLADKRVLLQRKVEASRQEMQRYEQHLGKLQRHRAARRRRAPAGPRSRRPRRREGPRQMLGATGILLGIGWIYLSFIQHNTFQLYPAIGSFILMGGGFGVLLSAAREPERPRSAPPGKVDNALADANLQKSAVQVRARMQLARDNHDQNFREVSRLNRQIAQLEQAATRSYLADDS